MTPITYTRRGRRFVGTCTHAGVEYKSKPCASRMDVARNLAKQIRKGNR